MKKIVWFSEWKNKSKHPFPTFSPFQQVSFKDRAHWQDADALVQVNVRHPYVVKEASREPFYEAIEQSNKPRIVFESAVFRKNAPSEFTNKYFRFSWNSFLWNEGNFGPMGNGSDRWERIQKEQNIEIKPWRKTRGKYILIFLQHVIDTSLFRMIEQHGSYYKWLRHTIKTIRLNTDMPIVIRPHPKHGMYTEFFEADKVPAILKEFKDVTWSVNQGSVNLSGDKYLEADLRDAHCALGWTTNALTEAACNGVPVYCLSQGAMATPVSLTDFGTIDNINECPDREQWLNDMAYCQWNYEEIQKGVAWEHIKNVDISHLQTNFY